MGKGAKVLMLYAQIMASPFDNMNGYGYRYIDSKTYDADATSASR